ncbi:amiloride-sensitive sodium channel subunit alpha-like [Dendronephthya gigantea]|uniref:amiloride-sensitive sodium channel subunit alpha-like n=1 Tax=Dendronephthya gigantea TaxID=151771 RepID=UPI00106D57BC|nr:amiloride-sensitive sodium channel subunit alpha-like [Dendronephthya gigantea]
MPNAEEMKMQFSKRDNRVESFDSTKDSEHNMTSSDSVKRKPGKYQQLLKEFSQESSAGGINKVFSSKPLLIRLIWVLLCVVCYGAMIYLSYIAIKTYFDKPTSTYVEVSFETDMTFPSVTICNLNKFRKDALQNLPGLNKIINNKKSDRANVDEENLFFQKMKRRSGMTLPAGGMNFSKTNQVSSKDILENAMLAASVKYSEKDLKKAGHQFEDLVSSCRWMGIQCNSKSSYFKNYWRNTWNWKYGNCYTFNFGLSEGNNTVTPLTTTKAGPKYGLTIDLFIEQAQYIRQLTEEAGVKVVIINGKQHPFPFQEGTAVSPGTATAIALRKEVIERVDRYSNRSCVEDTEIFDSIYNEDASLAYTIQSCLDTCLVEQQIKECNCSDARYARNGKACSNTTENECIVNVETKYRKDEYGCIKRCPQRCRSVSYRTTISEAQLSAQFMKDQRESLNTSTKRRNATKTEKLFKQDFLRIKIYFEELNLVRIHQEFSYTLTSLLSDIGGQLGLWVGLSVITFAEVGDLILSIILLVFSRN